MTFRNIIEESCGNGDRVFWRFLLSFSLLLHSFASFLLVDHSCIAQQSQTLTMKTGFLSAGLPLALLVSSPAVVSGKTLRANNHIENEGQRLRGDVRRRDQDVCVRTIHSAIANVLYQIGAVGCATDGDCDSGCCRQEYCMCEGTFSGDNPDDYVCSDGRPVGTTASPTAPPQSPTPNPTSSPTAPPATPNPTLSPGQTECRDLSDASRPYHRTRPRYCLVARP